MEKNFIFRFDIDSLADIEVGVPRLIDIAKELDVKFTFFVNMGKSFDWRTVLDKKSPMLAAQKKWRGVSIPSSHINTVKKMGLWRSVRTIFLNPCIGLRYKKILFQLLDEGHELGLHGGMNHPLWQWRLNSLSKSQINTLLGPAYNSFKKLFGRPKGFTSPGFCYNSDVLELIDDYGFYYASDMEGENPFRPEGYSHMQLPVNITAPGNVPLIEYYCLLGMNDEEVLDICKKDIEGKDCAVIYGHPNFCGSFILLKELLIWVKARGYSIGTMGDHECLS